MATKKTRLSGDAPKAKQQVSAATRAKLSAAQLGSRRLKGMAKEDVDRLKPTKLADSHGRSHALKTARQTKLSSGSVVKKGSR